MDMKKFDESINRLTQLYGQLPDDKMDIYYDFLKGTNPDILKRACDLVISNRTSRFFPQPAEIIDMIGQAYQEREGQEEPPKAGICSDCHGAGIILKDYVYLKNEYTMALACHCQLGKKFAKPFAKHRVRIDLPPAEEIWMPPPIEDVEPEEKQEEPDPY